MAAGICGRLFLIFHTSCPNWLTAVTTIYNRTTSTVLNRCWLADRRVGKGSISLSLSHAQSVDISPGGLRTKSFDVPDSTCFLQQQQQQHQRPEEEMVERLVSWVPPRRGWTAAAAAANHHHHLSLLVVVGRVVVDATTIVEELLLTSPVGVHGVFILENGD